jgi:hypothetical protein
MIAMMEQFRDHIALLIERGGFVMVPLLALSVVSLSLIVERSWFWAMTDWPGRIQWLARLNDALRLGRKVEVAETIKDIPIWAFHGAKDPTVKVEQSRGIVEALKAIDGKITYTEYPDKDHGISWEVFGDEAMHEWLFEQVRK